MFYQLSKIRIRFILKSGIRIRIKLFRICYTALVYIPQMNGVTNHQYSTTYTYTSTHMCEAYNINSSA